MSLALLSQPRREVLLCCLESEAGRGYGPTHTEIAARTGISPGVVARHLDALWSSDLLSPRFFMGEWRWKPVPELEASPCADSPPLLLP